MKTLIIFSLRRRFGTLTFALICLLSGTLFTLGIYADKVIEFCYPALLEKTVVVLPKQLDNLTAYEPYQIIFQFEFSTVSTPTKKQAIYLSHQDEVWTIVADNPISLNNQSQLNALITSLQWELLTPKQAPALNNLVASILSPQINYEIINNQNFSADKQQLSMLILSTSYFLVLGFCSLIATEVVNEKSSKVIELILTTVTAKTHFLAKIIIGWLSIMLHLLINFALLLGLLLIRHVYDQGAGLLAVGRLLNFVPADVLTFNDWLASFNFDWPFFSSLLLCAIFLLAGILLVQIILVILASHVSNIEEAGIIQGPTYILLLAAYYLALTLNTPVHLTQGLGYYLSFFPFFSMLLMPCRLMLVNVPHLEIAFSLLLATLALWLAIQIGAYFYARGLLGLKRRNLWFFKRS